MLPLARIKKIMKSDEEVRAYATPLQRARSARAATQPSLGWWACSCTQSVGRGGWSQWSVSGVRCANTIHTES